MVYRGSSRKDPKAMIIPVPKRQKKKKKSSRQASLGYIEKTTGRREERRGKEWKHNSNSPSAGSPALPPVHVHQPLSEPSCLGQPLLALLYRATFKSLEQSFGAVNLGNGGEEGC